LEKKLKSMKIIVGRAALSKDFPAPSLDGEETVVGVHSSGIMLEEGLNTSLSRNHCSNCRRKTHCYVEVNRKTREAIIHNTCTKKECECKCKTHFACKQCGSLHPYGQKCDRVEPKKLSNSKNDEEFDKIMNEYRKKQEEKNKPVIKKEAT
jgi:hypothetical protein